MIEIIGIPGSREYEVAQSIYEAFLSQWPGIDQSQEIEECVRIAANTKLAGYQVSDVDIVIAARFNKSRFFAVRRPIKDQEGKSVSGFKVRVKNFVCAVEVKSQDVSGVSISGDEINVRYQGSWKSATEQNVKQVHALKAYFEHQHQDCFVYRCVVLDGINELPKIGGQPKPEAGAVASNFTAGDFLTALAGVNGINKWKGEYSLSSGKSATIEKVLQSSIFQQIVPTRLDRKRMDLIAARKSEAKEIASLLGNQRVHIRGHGGTGKTVLMLQAAHLAYELHGRRCLVLTYNNALAGDIRRLLSLLGVPSAGEGGGVEIQTAMSFVYSWLARLGLREGETGISFEKYERECEDCLQLIDGGAISRADILAVINGNPEKFDFDAFIVDEAQDWPQPEARLLTALYGGEKVSIADGREQLVRGRPTDWSRTLGESQVASERSLIRCLRMKKNLGLFANAVAAKSGINWEIEPNDQAAGGKVILSNGRYGEDANLVERLVQEAKKSGNDKLDFLHCVPPSNVSDRAGKRSSALAGLLESHGYETWDAVDDQIRQEFARSNDAFRVLQYESNRGLEGWVTILDGFDEALKSRRDHELRLCREDESHSNDPNRTARLAAWRWAMISLTRPIDTLVITVRDRESEFSKTLYEVCADHRDFVDIV